MPYKNSFTIIIIKKYLEKIHHQLFKNQSLELSSSSEIDNMIQEEEAIFKNNPTVSLPEISKVIDSVISKGQGHKGNRDFWREKEYCTKREMDSLWIANISYYMMDHAMKQFTHQFHKVFFHISKCLTCNAEKHYGWR